MSRKNGTWNERGVCCKEKKKRGRRKEKEVDDADEERCKSLGLELLTWTSNWAKEGLESLRNGTKIDILMDA